MKDFVSIVIPIFNGEEFFDDAIRSIQAQTYPFWEVLLVDDGSADSSTQRALALAGVAPDRFKYLEHPGHQNRGAAASRNLGMRESRGEFITFLDIDDIWLPQKLQKQVSILSAHRDVSLVYGPLHFWYGWTGREEDARRDFVAAVYSPTDCVIEPPTALLRQIETSNGLPGTCSFLMRREVFEHGISHEEHFGMYEDEVFFSKVAIHHRMYFMRESLDRYRQHANSYCSRAAARGEYIPGRPNQGRNRYLNWLKGYVEHTSPDRKDLVLAIEKELLVYGK